MQLTKAERAACRSIVKRFDDSKTARIELVDCATLRVVGRASQEMHDEVRRLERLLLPHFKARLDWSDLEERAAVLAEAGDLYDPPFLRAVVDKIGTPDDLIERWRTNFRVRRPQTEFAKVMWEFAKTALDEARDLLVELVRLGWSEREVLGIHPHDADRYYHAGGLIVALYVARKMAVPPSPDDATEERVDIPLSYCGECFWRHRRRLTHIETVPIWNAPLVEARTLKSELN